MHTRNTTAALAFAALLLTATACSSGSDDNKATEPTSTAPATTSAPAYDPTAWKARIAGLITQLDQAQPECATTPSSPACADALGTADETVLDMQQDLKASGDTAGYPATADQLGKIHDGYTQYTTGACAGNPAADEQGSECRVAAATVMLGVATLPAKMTLDAG
jgi:hypothetical protein